MTGWLQDRVAGVCDNRQRNLVCRGQGFTIDGVNHIRQCDVEGGRSVDENVLSDIGSVAAGIGDGVGAENGEMAAVGDGVVRQ